MVHLVMKYSPRPLYNKNIVCTVSINTSEQISNALCWATKDIFGNLIDYATDINYV